MITVSFLSIYPSFVDINFAWPVPPRLLKVKIIKHKL